MMLLHSYVIALLQELEYKNNKLAEENKYLRTKCVNINKFYARTMNVDQVAYLHDVHPHTVRKYVSCGLIPKHPDSKDGKNPNPCDGCTIARLRRAAPETQSTSV